MARLPKFPAYPKKAHSTGQARISVRQPDGSRLDRWLGVFGSPQSYVAYQREMAEWQDRCKAGTVFVPAPRNALTLAMLVDRHSSYLAERHAEGELSSYELRDARYSMRPLVALYATLPAWELQPVHLKAVRKAMADGSWLAPDKQRAMARRGNRFKCGRRVIGQRIGRIKRMFRWAASEGLVAWDVFHRLSTDRAARRVEQDPVQPVPVEIIQKTLPHFGPVTKAMVMVQLLTGMRPGEMCQLKPEQIEKSGMEVDGVEVWLFRPHKHKTAYQGHKRTIVFGPQAQAWIQPFLDRPPGAYIFSPREEMQTYGNFTRRKFKDCYTPDSFTKRIKKACQHAQVPLWHAHRLRHTACLLAEEQFDLDDARHFAGHMDPRMTARYILQNLKTAARVASKIG